MKKFLLFFIAIIISLNVLSFFSDPIPKTSENNSNYTINQIFSIKPAYSADNILVNALDKSTSQEKWIFGLWNFSLSLVNIILIGVLLFLAIVNIVHFNYDTYQLKKYLMPLFIAVLLANFSMFISRAVVEFTGALTNELAGNTQEIAKGIQTGLHLNVGDTVEWIIQFTGKGDKVGQVMGGLEIGILILYGLLGVVIALVVAIIMFILGLILYLRLYVLFLLAGVAPVAWICMVLPATQGLFKQWWTWFLRFAFIGPLVALILKVASVIGNASGGSASESGASMFGTIGVVFIIVVLMIAAIIAPFAIGGMFAVPGLKQLGGFLKNQATNFYKGNATLQSIGARLSAPQKLREEKASYAANLAAAQGKYEAEQGITGWARAKKSEAFEGIKEGDKLKTLSAITGVGRKIDLSPEQKMAKRDNFKKEFGNQFASEDDAKKFFDNLGKGKAKKMGTVELQMAIEMANQAGVLDDVKDKALDYAIKDKKFNSKDQDAIFNTMLKEEVKQISSKASSGQAFDKVSGHVNSDVIAKAIAENINNKNMSQGNKEISIKNNAEHVSKYLSSNFDDPHAKELFKMIKQMYEKGRFAGSPDVQSKFKPLVDNDKAQENVVNSLPLTSTNPVDQKIERENIKQSFGKIINTKLDTSSNPSKQKENIDHMNAAIKAMQAKDASFDPTDDISIEKFFSNNDNKSVFEHMDQTEINKLKANFNDNWSPLKSQYDSIQKQIIGGI